MMDVRVAILFLVAGVALADVTNTRSSQDQLLVQPGENQVAVSHPVSRRWELSIGS